MSVMSWVGKKIFGGGAKVAFGVAATIFTIGACSMLFNQKSDMEDNFIVNAFEEGFDITGDITSDIAGKDKDTLGIDIG